MLGQEPQTSEPPRLVHRHLFARPPRSVSVTPACSIFYVCLSLLLFFSPLYHLSASSSICVISFFPGFFFFLLICCLLLLPLFYCTSYCIILFPLVLVSIFFPLFSITVFFFLFSLCYNFSSSVPFPLSLLIHLSSFFFTGFLTASFIFFPSITFTLFFSFLFLGFSFSNLFSFTFRFFFSTSFPSPSHLQIPLCI